MQKLIVLGPNWVKIIKIYLLFSIGILSLGANHYFTENGFSLSGFLTILFFLIIIFFYYVFDVFSKVKLSDGQLLYAIGVKYVLGKYSEFQNVNKVEIKFSIGNGDFILFYKEGEESPFFSLYLRWYTDLISVINLIKYKFGSRIIDGDEKIDELRKSYF